MLKTNDIIITIGDKTASLTHIVNKEVKKHIYSHWRKEEEVKKFTAVISKNRSALISIMLDTEMQYYEEYIINGLSERDIANSLESKLNEDLSNDLFRGIIEAGKTYRSEFETRYIFVNTPITENIRFWLNFVLNFNNPFKGVYLLPIEVQKFIKDKLLILFLPIQYEQVVDNYQNWQILITNNKNTGFRAIVVKDGIIFSTEIFAIEDNLTADKLAKELEKLITDLIIRIKLIPKDRLDLFIISALNVKNSFSDIKTKANNVIVLTPEEIAEQIGVRIITDNQQGYADEILVCAFAESKRVLELYNLEMHKITRMEKIILFWKRCVFLLPLFLVIYFTLAYSNNNLEDKVADLTTKLVVERELVADNKQNLKYIANDEIVKSFIPLYKQLSGFEVSPLNIIRKFMVVKNDQVIVTSITWMNKFHDHIDNNKIINHATLLIDFHANSNSNDTIFTELEQFIKNLKQSFKDYEVEYSREINDLYHEEMVIPLKVTIIGPIEESIND